VMHFIIGSDAPSQVLRVDTSNTPATIEEIFLDGGTQISAGSGGVTFDDRLLVGSITDKKILVCDFD